uniref:Coiled-coil domain-containing protein n=1 Tax=Globodera pallida TaxID=36090 RepID=A0A183BJY5_GLOPA
MVDSNENRVNSPAEFDLGANLEAYKHRCRALEKENARLMGNQGKLIAESNRRIECHLEEIRCLKEQMDAQRRTNGELLGRAQSAEDESRRAKELSKEWQKFGQCNNQLMKKATKLAAENMELKRLCIYLDEQRQTFWRELSGKTKRTSARLANPAQQFVMGSGRSSSEDAGCCRGSIVTNSTESVNDSNMSGPAGGKMWGDEERLKGQIQVDREQEEVLQSICSKLSNMALSVDGTGQNQGPKIEDQSAHKLHIRAPKIIANTSNGQEAATTTANICDFRRLSNSTVISNSSSVGTTAQYESGFSFSSSEDPTAVLVEHEFDETDGGRASRSAEQTLKVHELCTISEEEDKAENTRVRLVRLEELGRELELEEASGDVGCSSMVAEAGSMFTSLMQSVDHPLQKQQQQQLIDVVFGEAMESGVVSSHRNSTGSSSTSSGAFSGMSRCTEDGVEDTEGMGEVAESSRREDDDLPPRMPLITTNECCVLRQSFRMFPFTDQRSSSSMGVSVLAAEQQTLQRQSSTLPRTPLSVFSSTTATSSHTQTEHSLPSQCRVSPCPQRKKTLLRNTTDSQQKDEQQKR